MRIEKIPEFTSYEDMAAFWESYDLGNYWDQTEPAEFEMSPQARRQLRIRPRTVETVSLEIPKDTLESLKKVAATRDMSCHALLKFYIGQGLRQDLSKLYAERNNGESGICQNSMNISE